MAEASEGQPSTGTASAPLRAGTALNTDLAPSQTIRKNKHKKGDPNNNRKRYTSKKSTNKADSDGAPKDESLSSPPSSRNPSSDALNKSSSVQKQSAAPPKIAPTNDAAPTDAANTTTKKTRRKKKGKKAPKGSVNSASTTSAAAATAVTAGAAVVGKNKKARKKRPKKPPAPWKKFLPEGAVDPISLDPLVSLRYPPFALVATEPYEPVSIWPIPPKDEIPRTSDADEPKDGRLPVETEEDRQERILSEMWGTKLGAVVNKDVGSATLGPNGMQDTLTIDPHTRHYHLYDGRALAYYMVSQLQFIDPLNRRDLTRDELVNLDRYLRRHNFQDLNVTEAYDAKGVTISTAGAIGNTTAGRASILQQEAQILLNALFGGSPAGRPPPRNHLANEYEAFEESQQREQQQRRGHGRTAAARQTHQVDEGIHGRPGGGFMIIDDNLNPGLRGAASEFHPLNTAEVSSRSAPLSNWSAGHISSQHGHFSRNRAFDFPSLSATAPPRQAAAAEASPEKKQATKKVLPAPKTLSLINKLVKPTDPDEVQRQFEAREAARKKAMLSNLTYGSNPSSLATSESSASMYPTPATKSTYAMKVEPTDGQLQRNRAFAEALGVAPTTVRHTFTSGWARPTEAQIQLDEFGHELNATNYPDSLILKARELTGPLLKLEKKWRAFLADDTKASLPLNRMDRPMRAFVHAYSDFWKIHTESFDPEPNRYIHCMKMQDTSAPYPLLSEAARNWRGPQPLLLSVSVGTSDHSNQQVAGQPTTGRELPTVPPRVPLSLKPKSSTTLLADPARPGVSIGGAPTRSMTEVDPGNARFGPLTMDRERQKLELQKRTLPLEAQLFESVDGAAALESTAEDIDRMKEKRIEKARREKEAEARKQRLLEAAFASDDEDEGGVVADDGSDWSEDEEEALFSGSDDEGRV